MHSLQPHPPKQQSQSSLTTISPSSQILVLSLVYLLPVFPHSLSMNAYRTVLVVCFAAHLFQVRAGRGWCPSRCLHLCLLFEGEWVWPRAECMSSLQQAICSRCPAGAIALIALILHMHPPARCSHPTQVHKAVPLQAANFQGVKQWLARATPTQNFSYAMTALIFLSTAPATALLPSYIILAAYGVTAYGQAHFGAHPLWRQYGARINTFLSANRQKVGSACLQ